VPTPLHPCPASTGRPRRRRALLAGAVALVALLLAPVLGASSATAASPQAEAASTWLAGLVGPDGSVDSPYSGLPSLTWTANVALSLATTGNEPAALQRALDHLAADVGGYIAEGTSDPAGRISWLILLVDATGGDPRAFGGHDLVADLDARYGVAEPGLYGVVDDYTPVTNQSLALLALTAAGADVPAGAITWLVDQQCAAPVSAAGGWEGYRAPSGGGLEACEESTSLNFTSADSNSTAFAIEALEAVGSTGAVPAALSWLGTVQDTTAGPAVGGFGQRPGDDADPNSTAVVIQAIVAAGQSPTAAPWTVGGGSPLASLQSWIIASGGEAGALASPFSGGFADTFATYQGVWGLAEVAFPLPTPQPSGPTSTTTTTSAPGTTTVPVGVEAVSVTPTFTG
jgi:hypothetical protein